MCTIVLIAIIIVIVIIIVIIIIVIVIVIFGAIGDQCWTVASVAHGAFASIFSLLGQLQGIGLVAKTS